MELSQLPDVAIEMKPQIVPAAVDDGPYGIDAPVAPTTISWRNLVYKVPDGKGTKQLLRHISGSLRPGEMTAVIGPSGAGKTTLLNALAGFQTRSFEVDLFVNGQPFKERSFRKLSSYVMSGDDLLQHLTVRETVDAAAKLKLPSDVPYKSRSALVSRILKLWGLDTCENRHVKNLSTGQRKRVMLAQELVYSPPVLFLDEPTSGLDSSSALQCVLTLKQFARKGHTVACSIHQPSSRIFQLFDRLYVLGDGYCLYHGTVRDLLPTLTANGLQCPAFYNPADFLIEVASGEYGDVKGDLVRYAERHNDVFSTNPAPKSLANGGGHLNEPAAVLAPLLKQEGHGLVSTASCSMQMNVLLKRCYLSLIRNPMVFHLRLATHLLVGVCMGLLYYDIGGRADSFFNNATLVFFSAIFLTFTGMMPVVLSYPLEAAVFTRERNNSWYTLKAYYLSKSIVELPFQGSQPELPLVNLPAFLCILFSLSCALRIKTIRGRLPHIIRGHRLLDDITAARDEPLRDVLISLHPADPGRPFARNAHWCLRKLTGRRIPGARRRHSDASVQRVCGDAEGNAQLPALDILRVIRAVRVRRLHSQRVRIRQARTGVRRAEGRFRAVPVHGSLRVRQLLGPQRSQRGSVRRRTHRVCGALQRGHLCGAQDES
ncbi:ATP-binding cassette subfamily G member 4-like isoform X1 [Dermacentor andersoni]|uniref:ATP-binding cassette subfamily G member 4-like isoform X1 n=1 Tax=Dermacentor andersoni TaxID=34620 RepID=UPI0024166AFC|nr:ATP-binding cassette subfamily G member 4-like isoform X1 [Dermacentor andersoni]XP_054928410.1 ATP-binding cassette subfamily G member 4-like isoform X1 [Dermacentor andersoni]XP_054928411.1 ATP-binding cassette subfamily G member 4-like isoform X1 [Dermacentor andersoni]XP_054928413.1 ATP-binding cassette subfamily G member 4-like isoform X1 [Dermacentor andersoni]XP_054928414.1 ATP-binding cassette subfamily G member 4-like isoform X1 [Dermacentor andersoni]